MTERDLRDLVVFRLRWERVLVRNGNPAPLRTGAETQALQRWKEGKNLKQLAHALTLLEGLGVALVVVQKHQT